MSWGPWVKSIDRNLGRKLNCWWWVMWKIRSSQVPGIRKAPSKGGAWQLPTVKMWEKSLGNFRRWKRQWTQGYFHPWAWLPPSHVCSFHAVSSRPVLQSGDAEEQRAINRHACHMEMDRTHGIAQIIKCMWSIYDYSSKDLLIALIPLSDTFTGGAKTMYTF